MYEYTDKILVIARKRFVRVFNRHRSLLHADELNVLDGAKEMYDELEDTAEQLLLKIAKRYYKTCVKKPKTDIDRDWLLDMLEDYEPLTEYVYLHEVERKRARFAESVIATANKTKAVGRKNVPTGYDTKPFDNALRYWNDMFTQYAILTTDKAVITAYRDNGVKKVKWYTVPDERRCDDCRDLHGQVFPIDKIPPKPHWRCRCWWLPVKG